MANLPGSIKNLNTLLGEQLLDGGGGGGSSDFSTAEVTVLVTGSTDNAINFEDLIVIEEVGNQRHLRYTANFGVGDEESLQQFEVLLIDGEYAVVFNKTGTITVSGEAELLEADLLLNRGDCTITIS